MMRNVFYRFQRSRSGVSTHSGAHRQYLIWGPCLACHKSWSGVPNITSVTNSVNDMACCVISFTALTDLYRTIDSISLPPPHRPRVRSASAMPGSSWRVS